MKISLNNRNRHYLEYLPVFFVVAFLCEFLPISFLSRLYIYIGFCWPFAMTAPFLSEKTDLRKYRFSFIRIAYQFNLFLCDIFSIDKKYWSDPLMRSISPLFFCVLLGVIAGDWLFFLSLIGSTIFELNRFCVKKLKS